jgi:hypothetical protein
VPQREFRRHLQRGARGARHGHLPLQQQFDGALALSEREPQILDAGFAVLDQVARCVIRRIGKHRRRIEQRQLIGRDAREVRKLAHRLRAGRAPQQLA